MSRTLVQSEFASARLNYGTGEVEGKDFPASFPNFRGILLPPGGSAFLPTSCFEWLPTVWVTETTSQLRFFVS